jgi:ubiquilin
MGAPPSEDQIADMLSDPALIQTMRAAMDTPQFEDMMIQNNPMLANMPNAREVIRSPYFRRMLTDPEALRMASRMRRMMAGGDGANAFPAPGVTDNTPDSNAPAGGNPAQGMPFNPFAGMGGFGGAPGGMAGMPDLAAMFGGGAQAAPTANPASTPAPGADGNTQRAATGAGSQPTSPPGNAAAANPFAALFAAAPGGQGAGAAAQNPFGGAGMPQVTPEMMQMAMRMMGGEGGGNPGQMPGGMPAISPEMMQQAMQYIQQSGGFGGAFGGFGAPAAAAPADNRPPEEVYAEQLRQLNDMGFYDFDRNVQALRRAGGSVQGAIEHLLSS